MKNMVDIVVVLDEKYPDPKVTIQTKEKTKQVENIIYAIENISDNDFPVIPAYKDSFLGFISQRDIIRIYVHNRRVVIETISGEYVIRKPLSSVEELLNGERFFRISQSEIVNLYKVKGFDLSVAGTIGIEFDNGNRSWVARSRVKLLKERLMK